VISRLLFFTSEYTFPALWAAIVDWLRLFSYCSFSVIKRKVREVNINRVFITSRDKFSEDIDLAVDRKYFGLEGELGKSQRTRLRKAANKYITETLLRNWKKPFEKAGLKDVKIELEEIKTSDQEPVIISVS